MTDPAPAHLANGGPVALRKPRLEPATTPQWRTSRTGRFFRSVLADSVQGAVAQHNVQCTVVQHNNQSLAGPTVCWCRLALVLPTLHKTKLHRAFFAGLASMAVNQNTMVVRRWLRVRHLAVPRAGGKP